MLNEGEKNRKLNDLLDALDFNQARQTEGVGEADVFYSDPQTSTPTPPTPTPSQVVIFVKSVARAKELNKLLVECNFPSICIHRGMKQDER